MSIIVYQDVATPIVPIEGLAGRIRDALGGSLLSMRYLTPDFAGLYQDAAGNTSVTAVGQPVGLMLDRRFGLVRGPELFTEGGVFAGDLGSVFGSIGWLDGASASAHDPAAGTLTVTTEPDNYYGRVNIDLTGERALTPGSTYQVDVGVTFSNVSTHGPVVAMYASNADSSLIASGVFSTQTGVHSVIFRAEATTQLRLYAGGQNATRVYNYISIREIPGYHASQPTTTARPALRSGPLHIDYDGVDDYMRTVFPALGNNATIARSIPGVGAQILAGQTIAAGNWDDNVNSCATLVIDRALTGPETALVTAFLNQQAGV